MGQAPFLLMIINCGDPRRECKALFQPDRSDRLSPSAHPESAYCRRRDAAAVATFPSIPPHIPKHAGASVIGRRGIEMGRMVRLFAWIVVASLFAQGSQGA